MIIFVFDYDDTLFPTSYLNQKKDIEYPELIENSINKLISTCSFFGKVYIITNAEKGWIELTLERYITNCFEIKKLLKNNVFSTIDLGVRSLGPVSEWKKYAYKNILEKDFSDGLTHQLISFGDAEGDRIGSMSIGETFKNVIVKNVLFEFLPCFERILMQHTYITEIIPSLVSNRCSLDLKIMIHRELSSSAKQNSSSLLNKDVSMIKSEEKALLPTSMSKFENDMCSEISEVGKSEVGKSEVGKSEVGKSEVGKSEPEKSPSKLETSKSVSLLYFS
jgi:hypothetical protein